MASRPHRRPAPRWVHYPLPAAPSRPRNRQWPAAALPLSLQLAVPSLVFRSATGGSYDFDIREGGITYLTQLDGISVPDLLNESVQTPSRDGETYIRTVLEPRFIKIGYTLVGASFDGLQDERRRLVRLLNPRLGLGRLEYTPQEGRTYSIDAILETPPRFTKLSDRVLDVHLTLRCPDPAFALRPVEEVTMRVGGGLSVPVSFPLSITQDFVERTVVNSAELETYPIFYITGVVTSPKVENVTTGKHVQMASDFELGADDTLVIDMAAQTIKIGATSKIGKMTNGSELWAIEPGTNEIKVSSTSGEGNYRMRYAERYLGV